MINNSINLILQGKGGVGKSFISSMLSQYFLDSKKVNFFGADTDPVNHSFSNISRLNARNIEILKDGAILQSKFDGMFESIINEEQITFVVDNGASTFIPMIKYIKDNDIISMFDEMNRPFYIHTIIVGGQSQADTIQGLTTLFELIEKSNNIKLIIWLNEFQGEVKLDTNLMKLVKNKTAGVVVVKNWNSDAFTSDLEKMTTNRLTLEEALQSSDFNLMAKNRLKRIFNDVYVQLDSIFDTAE